MTDMKNAPSSPSARGSATSSRRCFVSGAALSLGALLAAPPRRALAKSGRGSDQEAKAFKVSLSQWSLHKEIASSRLDARDVARVANGLGIDAVEYSSRFMAGKAGDPAYLADLKRRAVGEGVWSLLIRVQGQGALGAADAKMRRRAVEAHRPWLDAAAYLGCHAIGVGVESEGSEDEQASRSADGLRQLSELGDRLGIDVLAENREGFSAKGSWLAEVVTAVGHARCGTLPDFDNFDLGAGRRYDRAQGLRDLMPTARGVSAKAYDFDARGNEKQINYPLLCKIVTDAGYRGYVGITYEGKALSEYAGIERTKHLLERTRSELASRAVSLRK